MRHTQGRWQLVLVLLTTIGATQSSAESDQVDRVVKATTVLEEIMGAPDKAIPHSVLAKAEGIAVFPSTVKGGFIFGAHRGRGIISVRDRDADTWSAPAFLTLTGGSFGAQIGAQAIDVVLVIMNRQGLENLLGNQFKLGVDASVAAGPVGRDAEVSTDVQMRATILSYSRARGLFAGVTLKGTAIRRDKDSNDDFYGKPYETREIVLDGLAGHLPDVVDRWRRTLNHYAR